LAPIVIGYIYPLYGFSGVFIMITTILIIGTLTVMILGQETKAKSLEEVEIDDKKITDSTLKGNDRDKTISK
jgi:MFS transporter, putative metabolite:H+ symporter